MLVIGILRAPPLMVATSTSYSFAQLEQLWTEAGGSPAWASVAAGVALAESGGNPQAQNASGATGLWQILGPHNGVAGGAWNPSVQQQLMNPAANAAAAVTISGNGATWRPWVSDPVGNAQVQNPTQPLSEAQILSILGGKGLSTGGQTAQLTSATSAPQASGSSHFGIPPQAPSVPSGASALNPASDLSFAVQWGGWALLTIVIFVLGMTLVIVSMVMLFVVLLSPVAKPAASAIGGRTPVGRVTRSVRSAARSTGGSTSRLTRREQTHSSGLRMREREHASELRMTEREHRASAGRYTRGEGRGRTGPKDEQPF
jgi:hypothetical protein